MKNRTELTKVSTVAAAVKTKAESRREQLQLLENVKCDCGHLPADHYNNEGFCHHSKHANPGACGCTYYYPNVAYIKEQQAKKKPDQ